MIEEAPLSVEVRDGWRSVADRPRDDGTEAEEYCILLGTGGPASRIVGDLDSCQPTTARFEYQDWGKPWTQARLTDEDTATLLEWAQQFYFGG